MAYLYRHPLLLLAASLSALQMGSASAAQSAPETWGVDWGTQYCALTRTSETSPTLVIRNIPGTGIVDVGVVAEDSQINGLAIGGRSVVVLAPSAERFGAFTATRRGGRPGHSMLVLKDLEPRFLDQLDQSTEMRIMRGERTGLSVSLPKKAVQAFRGCRDGTLKEWGVDSKAAAALREQPKSPGLLVESRDYPPAAADAGISGLVVVRLSVTAEGKVSDCAVVGTSGDSELDNAACRLWLRRGNYKPAIGPDGKRTATQVISTLDWGVLAGRPR